MTAEVAGIRERRIAEITRRMKLVNAVEEAIASSDKGFVLLSEDVRALYDDAPTHYPDDIRTLLEENRLLREQLTAATGALTEGEWIVLRALTRGDMLTDDELVALAWEEEVESLIQRGLIYRERGWIKQRVAAANGTAREQET